jgi:hypothetical protein
MLFTATATAQGDCFPYCFKCNVMIIDAQSKKIVEKLDFKPLTGEEELTHKIVKIPQTGSTVHATVFFTDESLASNVGYDSISLALAVARNNGREPKGLNNASAEVTLNNFDTARVMTPVNAGKRSFVAVLECRAPESKEVEK